MGFATMAKRVYVAGHSGMVGSALLRRLADEPSLEILTARHETLDLLKRDATFAFVRAWRPNFVFLAAARVGGILANDTFPADFVSENLRIQQNVIDAALEYGVEKLVFLGSSCIYPRHAEQPIRETALLSGPLEPTNEWYAIAKIAGIKLCQAYRKQHGFNAISVMPTNLYGPNDNFDLDSSHVVPALIRKIAEAKLASASTVTIWGSGRPRREFLHVDDLADACVYLLHNYDSAEPINVGLGSDISIAELASRIARIAGYEGEFVYDTSKPDGTPRKLLDVTRLRELGWSPRIGLDDGFKLAYDWYVRNVPRQGSNVRVA